MAGVGYNNTGRIYTYLYICIYLWLRLYLLHTLMFNYPQVCLVIVPYKWSPWLHHIIQVIVGLTERITTHVF